ncbi:hypothetical protein LCGC14_1018770 [marine sediment metagenome]|uniref:N-acetyltransferase domain-containing protein n=1 Tax=marine sediment metagenome TaxID=412755 RepID=A0A0F9MY13_9ZZZZ
MIYDSEIIEEINDGKLTLRKISKHDGEFLYDGLNEKGMTEYLSLQPLKTLEHSKRIIRNYLKYWDNYVQFNYIIVLQETNKVKVGSISLWNVNWRHRRAEIGIWIIPSYWSRGLGKNSISLIKKIAFNHLKLNRLEAHIVIENTNSISLFKKSGFREEGSLKQYLNFNGKYHDALILACLKRDLNK